MPDKIVNVFEYVFPILSAVKNAEETYLLDYHEVFGTAFYLKNGFFFTAAHVPKNAGIETAKCVIAYRVDTNGTTVFRGLDIDKYELHEKNDFAILHVSNLRNANPQTFLWEKAQLVMNVPVSSMGYPYALRKGTIFARAFRGSVVSMGSVWDDHDELLSYELSFVVPRGLSGGPLLKDGTPEGKVSGIITANQTIGMEMPISGEKIGGDDKEKILMVEHLNLGIAISLDSFKAIKSDLLGSTVEEYLVKEGLL